MIEVMHETRLAGRPADVWVAVTTQEGVNYEMRPFIRMTFPASYKGKSIDDLPVGVKVGRCWLLLLSLIPIDFDDLVIAELGPGYRFLERSTMLSMARWQHEREITAEGSGSLVTDRLTFELRTRLRQLPLSDSLFRAIVTSFFRHRHRRLRKRFGSQ